MDFNSVGGTVLTVFWVLIAFSVLVCCYTGMRGLLSWNTKTGGLRLPTVVCHVARYHTNQRRSQQSNTINSHSHHISMNSNVTYTTPNLNDQLPPNSPITVLAIDDSTLPSNIVYEEPPPSYEEVVANKNQNVRKQVSFASYIP